MIKNSIKILSTLIILYSLSFILVWQVRDFTYLTIFDLLNNNPVVENEITIDSILNSFETLNVNQLDENFLKESKISSPDYSGLHKQANFYIVNPKEIYQFISGSIRIRDVLSRDEFYSSAIMNRSKSIYWRIDKKILYKILELREELIQQDYNENGFEIRHGYRTPKHNEIVGGASKSRHLKGEAVDMVISDINKDGKYTDADKQIVIDILERKVIRNQGGIGKYPGTRTVHMDVRGFRARWDSY